MERLKLCVELGNGQYDENKTDIVNTEIEINKIN